MPSTAPAPTTMKELRARLVAVEAELNAARVERSTAQSERDEYKRLYVALMEAYRKLEAGLTRHHRERFEGGEEQLVLALLAMMSPGKGEPPTPEVPKKTAVAAHERVSPTGRKPLPESLPRVDVEVLPVEVQREGLDAFERIGEDVTETVERRAASLVVVRTVRPKYVRKKTAEGTGEALGTNAAPDAGEAPDASTTPDTSTGTAPGVGANLREIEQAPGTSAALDAGEAPDASTTPDPSTAPGAGAGTAPGAIVRKVEQAPAPQLPIPRGLAGPGLLATTVVQRWDDHQPLYRLERFYGREGWPLARSTICGWHFELAELVRDLVDAMWFDAINGSLLCIDATGVLVQALKKCRTAHFFVVVAPDRHVLFGYSKKHDSAAVKKFLEGFEGTLVADAHVVYEFLYRNGDVLESGCWSHARRYWFKALESDNGRAQRGLTFIGSLFALERKPEWAVAPPEEKVRLRQQHSKPIVDTFFEWCDEEAARVLDETPISKAIGYARNQRVALSRFLSDGRLPIHNNWSENALRREALGRKNWLFVGNDEGGEVNARLVTLLASCKLHELEPVGYLRDIFCLLPTWPAEKLLDLAPVNWRATVARPEVERALATNAFRRVSLGLEPLPSSPQPSAAIEPPPVRKPNELEPAVG